jgi:hypothetical protein
MCGVTLSARQDEPADGYAERTSAPAMLATALPGSRRITRGADKGYDTAELTVGLPGSAGG